MSQSEFKKTIGLSKFAFQLMGIWPESQHKYSSFKFFTIFFSILFFGLIPQTKKLISVINNLNDVVEILTNFLLIEFISWCKFFSEWWKGEGKVESAKLNFFFLNNKKFLFWIFKSFLAVR